MPDVREQVRSVETLTCGKEGCDVILATQQNVIGGKIEALGETYVTYLCVPHGVPFLSQPDSPSPPRKRKRGG